MLIALEGIDGSGKSTIAAALADWLRSRGVEVVTTREPWDSDAGKQLRSLLAQSERTSTAEEEWQLFHADRREHVQKLVRPALARGAYVVQDRTFYSTAAYQGARGLDPEEILRESRRVAPEPDLTVLLSIRPETALARIRRGRETFSSFERLESLREVARIYAELAEASGTLAVVDAEQDPAVVLAAVQKLCLDHTPHRNDLPPKEEA